MYRVLSARRVSCRSDLLGRECPRRILEDALQPRGPEQGPRPHLLHPAQPGRFCRLVAIGLGPGRVRSQEQRNRRILRPRVSAPRPPRTHRAIAKAQILDTRDAGGRWHPQLAWVTLRSPKEKE